MPATRLTQRARVRLSTALRDRVAGPEAEARARAIWLAPGERRFAPGDPICRVHGHAGMYAGGIRALLLQSLHPLAMAGVGEHSGYRGDPWGRLQRTSEFIAMTTYGPKESAQRVIDRINRVHRTVRGTARDGRPYSATDPHLLRWVHVAEIDSFLVAHQHYARTPLTPAEADGYVAQASWAADQLGVVDPPRSVADLEAALTAYRPELEASEGARDVARFLLAEPPLPWAARPGFWLLAAGAVRLLPGYARELLGLQLPGRAQALDRPALAALDPLGRLGTAAVGWALSSPEDPRNHPDSSAVRTMDRGA
ncbi:oxygenase MpaB family protein [Serinicoccus kebangsaanensis]|uniref:oxygenase MpaB family protein n=1 Tax=Serinicoccus kebangsaanensis TaxID=2602069 RepID=UPI00124C6920|nr:oxygenase MpaB family protein [Serinicoccus kebangsaanensis]